MWYHAIGRIVMLTLSRLVAPGGADAQQGKKVWRIGFLAYTTPSLPAAFRQGLRDLGYVKGQDMVIEFRSADGTVDRLDALATEPPSFPQLAVPRPTLRGTLETAP